MGGVVATENYPGEEDLLLKIHPFFFPSLSHSFLSLLLSPPLFPISQFSPEVLSLHSWTPISLPHLRQELGVILYALFLIFFLCIYLAVPGLSCSMQNLSCGI